MRRIAHALLQTAAFAGVFSGAAQVAADYRYGLVTRFAALMSHCYWGLLLLVTLCHGKGMLSLDYWLRRRYAPALR